MPLRKKIWTHRKNNEPKRKNNEFDSKKELRHKLKNIY